MALVLTQTADTENEVPVAEGDDIQPSLELLLHLAQWETADGEFMDPMLLSEEDGNAPEQPEAEDSVEKDQHE